MFVFNELASNLHGLHGVHMPAGLVHAGPWDKVQKK